MSTSPHINPPAVPNPPVVTNPPAVFTGLVSSGLQQGEPYANMSYPASFAANHVFVLSYDIACAYGRNRAAMEGTD
ncbi:hypothetical protein C8R46DRAFT_1218151 [Mycena filopes]|nr:hypothetical protein C8R46DRAFT_1218151 [Mycena filopes]